jgi:cellobiose transport system substrate-binding protein
MELSRRRILQAGLLGLAGTAIGGAASACGDDDSSGGGGDSKDLKLWYWPGGLSGTVLADVATQFPDISFEATEVGGDFKEKLVTTITARQFLPDITGLKGEDIAYFMSQADQFLDLRDVGADDLKSQYLEWKWAQGSTPDGKQIGFPIDIGPTGLYYRADVYEEAGLPTEPAEVAAAMSTWDDFFAAGVELKGAVPDAFMVVDASAVFTMAVGQGTQRYVDPAGAFIGDQQHIRTAWDLAVKSVELGVDGKTTSGGQDFNAAINSGTLPSVLGAAWLALDIKSAAEDTSGMWRVAPTPGGPANIGGSFLAITANSGNPEKAFEIITWLLNADNQARGFTDSALFPSMPAVYDMDALTGPDEFFGGQATIEVFGPAAENIPVAYESEHDAALQEAYLTELTNIEASGKDPEAAWSDAVAEAQRVGERLGVG